MKKAIVIGNGKSLNKHLERGDFELFKKVDTFAMNKIDGLYHLTDWRPTYWIWVEFLHGEYPSDEQIDRFYEANIEHQQTHCIVDKRFYNGMTSRHPDTKYLVDWMYRCNVDGHFRQFPAGDRPRYWHVDKPCVYGGTMNSALWYADYFGYKDIAVVGCDLGIIKPSRSGYDHNHFNTDYITHVDGSWSRYNDTLRDMHKTAMKELHRNGKRIVNCGIGGELEVYPRAQLRNWL